MPYPMRLLTNTDPRVPLRVLPRTLFALNGLGDAPAAIAINAGGDARGSFVADAGYTGGSTYSTTSAIDVSSLTGSAVPAEVFQTERYGEFSYTIPNLTPGSAYAVTLYFAEIYNTAAGQRVFDVAINGVTVLSAFDIFVAAGGANKAVAGSFNTTADASGQVVIQFIKGTADVPKVSGILIAAAGSSFKWWYVGIPVGLAVVGVVAWQLLKRRKRPATAPLAGASWRRYGHRSRR